MPALKKKTSKPQKSKPAGQVVLSPVMSYENPGQLTVPNHLSIGNDGKLYLTRTGQTNDSSGLRQLISVKESVAWFRLGHECNLNVTRDAGFTEWLKIIEQSIPGGTK
jgi:hypothetical protein